MPRFSFDTFDGDVAAQDDMGLEPPDMEAARREAQMTLPHMAQDALPDGNYRTFVVNVRDENGKSVLRAALSLVMSEGPFDD
ncbi:DUF6894 family protein [Microvirga lotononidis]|uniref:DUF6894 domain-containing protein n=1 Tax=Microvirga lotononidis TaxID=864069 RepID=I4YKC6_9HYPH|nr:hypothetical protein [Microvirga lotononidis]EIM24418.1 hypothetical protein MicloDRAFT_00069370 [Microvirga lotononidis]WQO31338.1 hypothetical protein U0023_34190 [Microvirga lotononidis]